MNKTMSTPIEALAQEYADLNYPIQWIKSSDPGYLEDCNKRVRFAARDSFLAGAKAASGQGEALLKHCDQVLSAASSVGEIQFKTCVLSSQVCDAIKEVRALIKEALSGAGKGEA